MAWTPSIYVLPNLLAGVVSALVVAFAWGHRRERTGGPFVLLMLGLAWWSIAYGIELGFTDTAAIVLWDKIAFVGSVTVPAALFLLGVEYAGFDDWFPDWTPALLAVEPLVTLALVWTYPESPLVWESVTVDQTGAVALPAVEFGVWYWVNYAYSYLLIGAGLAMIASVFVRGSRVYRRQSALLILGVVVPLGANVLYNVFPGLSPFPAVDLTTFAMTSTGVLYGLALFKFRMLDFAPVAGNMLLDEVGDGFVVVDDTGDVLEGNEVGTSVLGRGPSRLQRRAGSRGGVADLDGQVLSVHVDDVDRSYELRTDSVTDFRGEQLGTLLVFRDITELEVVRRHEQRLSVMNRIVRHNIRNEMNVVQGYAELLAESLSGADREYAELIARKATRMISVGEKAHHIGVDLDPSPEREVVDVVPVVESSVEDARADYPAAAFSVRGAAAGRARVTGRKSVATAVSYLLENAVEHNDTAEPTVTVAVDSDETAVEITVRDDGPGIPAGERTVIASGSETPLEHGSGLGLWIVYWLVSRSNGTVSFDENEPRGSAVTIRLPAANADGDAEFRDEDAHGGPSTRVRTDDRPAEHQSPDVQGV
ncbi:sensor histidine kinase [Halobacterium wangiae]|uniref:sensor histidine kinase n=1 Tax=Halobacterium wangiae TaxID=2902623 RepID=UPI001E4D0507|nr:histidine kinase N-terminal 7TM domain-containing protein [Halobacterium wangiae]